MHMKSAMTLVLMLALVTVMNVSAQVPSGAGAGGGAGERATSQPATQGATVSGTFICKGSAGRVTDGVAVMKEGSDQVQIVLYASKLKSEELEAIRAGKLEPDGAGANSPRVLFYMFLKKDAKNITDLTSYSTGTEDGKGQNFNMAGPYPPAVPAQFGTATFSGLLKQGSVITGQSARPASADAANNWNVRFRMPLIVVKKQ
jgi:hypothetical protein